ncbi:MAG: ATPase domain-containing protein [Candidatus Margulisiibacteriota bacterium]
MNKLKSGIEAFDQLLDGGFPEGRSYLISGEPGTGKTIFCLQFLLEGVRQGKKGLYICIDERPEHIIADAASLGWNILPHLENKDIQLVDITTHFLPKADQPVNTDSVIGFIIDLVRSQNIGRMAIDPIAPLVFSSMTSPEANEYIRKLIFAIEDDLNCTTLLTSYIPVGSDKVSHHGIEEFAASGIILLKLTKLNNKFIRTIRLRKMRATKIDLTEYSFDILPNRGIVIRQPI